MAQRYSDSSESEDEGIGAIYDGYALLSTDGPDGDSDEHPEELAETSVKEEERGASPRLPDDFDIDEVVLADHGPQKGGTPIQIHRH